MVARQSRLTSERSVAAVAFDVNALSLSHNNSNNHGVGVAVSSLRVGAATRFFDSNDCGVQHRNYSSSVAVSKEYAPNPLDAFRDPVDRQTRMQESVGRQWSVKELRRKSYEDLHRLWYVLYKEKNMLLTEQQLSRRRQLIFPQPERFKKVQKSMGAIRQVLGERKRETVAAHLTRHREKELAKQMTAELDRQDAAFIEIEESGSDDNGGDEINNDNDTTK
jgi:hypothetical protein